MSFWKRPVFLIPLILASLSCQAVYKALPPTQAGHLNTTQHQIDHQASPTPLPSTPTHTPSPSPTVAPSATATASPTTTLTPSPVHFAVFEDLWGTIRDFYLYPDFNGLDWDAIYNEYYQRISAGLSDQAFYTIMAEMVTRLGDDHSVFLEPQEASEEDAGYAGENDYVGIGIITTSIPDRKRISIILVFPDSPAERAGLQPHDNILAVDGEPVLDENGFRRDLLRGPVGSLLELTVQTPDQEPRQISMTRERIQGSLPVPSELLTTRQGKRVGYLLLTGFTDEKIDDQVSQVLIDLSRDGPLDGLIIDNRQNAGGADDVARRVLSNFTSGVMGNFVDRNNAQRSLRVIGTNINGSNRIPLVILIGPNTVSFGEIFSGILHDTGRAYLIGEATEGNMELLWGYDFEDGSRAWIAREMFHPRNHPDQNWEESGIIPDLIVSSNWDEVTLDTDPAVVAALEHLDISP